METLVGENCRLRERRVEMVEIYFSFCQCFVQTLSIELVAGVIQQNPNVLHSQEIRRTVDKLLS